jgi:hypothetical protein
MNCWCYCARTWSIFWAVSLSSFYFSGEICCTFGQILVVEKCEIWHFRYDDFPALNTASAFRAILRNPVFFSQETAEMYEENHRFQQVHAVSERRNLRHQWLNIQRSANFKLVKLVSRNLVWTTQHSKIQYLSSLTSHTSTAGKRAQTTLPYHSEKKNYHDIITLIPMTATMGQLYFRFSADTWNKRYSYIRVRAVPVFFYRPDPAGSKTFSDR